MSFFKKLSDIFYSSGGHDDRAYWIYARCNRCGEKVRARVDLSNNLSVNYNGGKNTYFCRKVLIGEERCFEKIEVEFTYDQNRKLIDRQITGGQFISEEEFFEDQEPPA